MNNLAGTTVPADEFVTAVAGGVGPRAEWARELWRFRELLYFFVWRDVKIRYRQTLLGVAWAVLQPVLTAGILWVVFSRVTGGAPEGVPYPLFCYTGLLGWVYFSSVVSTASMSLVSNTNLLTKVYFPRAILTMAAVVSGIPDLLLSAVALVALFAFYQVVPDGAIVLFPVLVVLLMMLGTGMGLILAALNAQFRDVKYAVPFLLQLWMFATPIIYPVDLVPERMRPFMMLNPMTGLVNGMRAALLPSRGVDWVELGTAVMLTALILAVGLAFFRQAERTLADVI